MSERKYPRRFTFSRRDVDYFEVSAPDQEPRLIDPFRERSEESNYSEMQLEMEAIELFDHHELTEPEAKGEEVAGAYLVGRKRRELIQENLGLRIEVRGKDAEIQRLESERDHAAALVTKHGQENIRLRAELVEALKRVAELEKQQ